MKYHPYLYDKLDPAEIETAPTPYDIEMPMLAERLALESSLASDEDKVRRARYRAQADTVAAIYYMLDALAPKPGGAVELSTSATAFAFCHLTKPALEAGDDWQGRNSPWLSRLKLIDLEPYELTAVFISLWSDNVAWTPAWGQALTPPAITQVDPT